MYSRLVAQVRTVYSGSLDDTPITQDMVELIYDSFAMILAHSSSGLLETFPMERNDFAVKWARRTLSGECIRAIVQSTLDSEAFLVLAVVKSKWEMSRAKLESLPKTPVTTQALKIGRELGDGTFSFNITNVDSEGNPLATPCVIVPEVEIKPRTRLALDCYPIIHQQSIGVPLNEIVPFMFCGVPPMPDYRGHSIRHCGVSTIVAERFVRMAYARIPLFNDLQHRIDSRKASHDSE